MASDRLELADALAHVLGGDLLALPTLAAASLDEIRAAVGNDQLVLRAGSVVAVLRSLRAGECSRQEAHRWGAFVRRGYLAGGRGPVRPLDIEYEQEREDSIAEAISRLDEIGDLVDGEVTTEEIDALLRALGADPAR